MLSRKIVGRFGRNGSVAPFFFKLPISGNAARVLSVDIAHIIAGDTGIPTTSLAAVPVITMSLESNEADGLGDIEIPSVKALVVQTPRAAFFAKMVDPGVIASDLTVTYLFDTKISMAILEPVFLDGKVFIYTSMDGFYSFPGTDPVKGWSMVINYESISLSEAARTVESVKDSVLF